MPRTLKTGIGLAAGLVVLAASVGLCLHLFWPLKHDPQPAAFHCYDLNEGDTIALDTPKRAFGVGLAYAAHIRETASSYTPGAAPPIFEKQVHGWCGDGATVPIPNAQALRDSINTLEPGLGDALDADNLDALVDYEVEMGFVLLEAIDPPQLDTPDFVPKLGFFVANDLSARSVAILGEGQLNRYAWWGASKSFPGFMPVSGRAWVPRQPAANGIPCVNLETRVNEEVRQSQETVDLIYTPREMLVFLRDTFPDATLEKGTVVLTGTPGGVAMATPRALVRLSNLVGLDRETKLRAKLNGDRSRFLRSGDRVLVSGGALGTVEVLIGPP